MTNDEKKEAIETALTYLKDGGLGETSIGATMALEAGELKVQLDTATVIALCILANEHRRVLN